MLCQHCENAPCENVCPVAATNHSSEGLNQMAYNRCIGTRYCANNCPYKVRRFNWLDYTTADVFPWNEPWKIPTLHIENPEMTDAVTRMVLNPDVTVRSRGVMEKCSFCVQRLQDSKLVAKKEGRPLRDGDTKTACQTACPTDAIQFGNVLEEKSVVRNDHDDARAYYVLSELNTRPSIAYMKKVRNTNEPVASYVNREKAKES
jgi:molybdopterin-containing oxidoreductase family iron-sulfur binding subunit